MKTTFQILSFFSLVSSLLLSCVHSDKRTNIFIEGNFYGIYDYSFRKEEYFFNVYEINELEFNDANGNNVVYDVVLSLYFQFELYYYQEDGEKHSCNFVSLYNRNPNLVALPITYSDDRDNEIQPFASINNDYTEPGYRILYYDIEIFLNKLED